MPLVNAKCTNCGADLKVDNTKDAAICEYCGSAYIVEKAINNYNMTQNIRASVVNVYNSYTPTNILNKKLTDAENETNLGYHNNALEIYKTLSIEYPREHSVWKGYMLCFFSKQIKEKKFSDINIIYTKHDSGASDVRGLSGIIKLARITCPKEELHILDKTIDDFFKKLYQDTLNGDFEFLSCYKDRVPLEESFTGISEMHPLMKKLSVDCINIAIKLKQMNIHYGYPAHRGKISFWTDKLIPKERTETTVSVRAIVGRECIWYYSGHNFCDDNKVFHSKLPITATDEDSFYKQIQLISDDNLRNIKTCPFCETGNIKKTILGKNVCTKCKQIILK